MKPIFLALSTLLAAASFWASAVTVTTTAEAQVAGSDFKSRVMAKAAESRKGVIVVISDHGEVAAYATYLLSAQLKQNPGFVPLLLVPEQERLESYMKTLALPRESLPAVIFFNKSGRELGRVIGAQPTTISLLSFNLH